MELPAAAEPSLPANLRPARDGVVDVYFQLLSCAQSSDGVTLAHDATRFEFFLEVQDPGAHLPGTHLFRVATLGNAEGHRLLASAEIPSMEISQTVRDVLVLPKNIRTWTLESRDVRLELGAPVSDGRGRSASTTWFEWNPGRTDLIGTASSMSYTFDDALATAGSMRVTGNGSLADYVGLSPVLSWQGHAYATQSETWIRIPDIVDQSGQNR